MRGTPRFLLVCVVLCVCASSLAVNAMPLLGGASEAAVDEYGRQAAEAAVQQLSNKANLAGLSLGRIASYKTQVRRPSKRFSKPTASPLPGGAGEGGTQGTQRLHACATMRVHAAVDHAPVSSLRWWLAPTTS